MTQNNFKVTEEMMNAFIESIWRELYKAVETKNVDLLYTCAINMMQISAAKRLYKSKIDEK